MKENFKRYLAIIPAVFVLLLSSVPMLGAYADGVDIDSYLHDPSGISGFEEHFSLENVQQTLNNQYSNCTNHDFYFYVVYASSYNNHPDDYPFTVQYFTFDSDIPYFEDDQYIVYQSYTYFTYTANSSSSNSSFYRYYSYLPDNPYLSSYNYFLVYDKTTGQCSWDNKTVNQTFRPSSISPQHIYYQDSNLTDFPFYEGAFHPGGNGLNVSVTFDPSPVGNVTNYISHNGAQIENPLLQMRIVNSGRKNVHYAFFIVDPGYDICTFLNAKPYPVLNYTFPSSVRYVLTGEDWHQVNYLDNSTTLAKGKTFWSIMHSGDTKNRFMKWSQMNILKNTNYDAVLVAYSTDLDYLPVFGTPSFTACQGSIQEVYRSTFTLQFDTHFDPNDDSFGNSAYIPGTVFDSDQFSQYYDADGNLQTGHFTSGDINGNRNSSNHYYNGNTYDGSYNGVTSSGGSFNNLSYSISGFLSFFNCVWSYIPSNYAALLGLSITSLVVIAIFKGVFR